MRRATVIESLESRCLLSAVPTFASATSPTGKAPVSVAVGDFNKDGKLDFITANSNSGTVTIAYGKGNGTFGSQKQMGIGSTPMAVVVGDFNKDGKLDFAAALQPTNQVVVYLGDGAGGFTKSGAFTTGKLTSNHSATSYGTGAKLAVGDFDNDGKLDLAVLNVGDNTVSILRGQGNGQFLARVTTAVPTPPSYPTGPIDLDGLDAGDFNGDGKTDLVVSGYMEVVVMLSNGNGTLSVSQQFEDGENAQLSDAHDVVTADFNGDQILDLAAVAGDEDAVTIFKGLGGGQFAFDHVYGTDTYEGLSRGPVALTAGDFNNDGYIDLATANPEGASRTILINDGTGHFPQGTENPVYDVSADPPPVFAESDRPLDIATGDFNGDGKLDLITADGYVSSTTVLLNTTPLTQAGPPVVNSFTISPSTFTVGTPMQLTANVTETNGAIANVKFFIDVDGTPGLNPNTDFFLGTATSSTSTFTVTADTSSYTPGTYDVYAYATDGTGQTAQKSAVITAVGAPVITEFDGPTDAYVGTTITLRASASENGGTISSVKFYRESNNTNGLQTGSDTLLGTGTFANGFWNINVVAGNTPTLDTYYAVATDAHSVNSQPALKTVTVNDYEPGVTDFTASPSSTMIGSTVLLSAKAIVYQPGESGTVTITGVKFYRESNGTDRLEIGSDTLVGSGTLSNGVWSINTSTAGLPAGTQTYYAVATCSAGPSSAARSTTVTLTTASGSPVINSFTINPNSYAIGTNYQLTANATETGGTIANVKYYIDTDGTVGLNTATDQFLGTATSGTSSFTLTADSSSYTPGTYTVFALATDSGGVTAQTSATMTANGTPVVSAFTVSPGSAAAGTALTLSATASENKGSISKVTFFRESNNSAGLQTGGDTLIGTGTLSNGKWSISTATTGLAAGAYTYYAVATDAMSNNSAAASASATLTGTTPPPPGGTLLAWEVSGQAGSGTQGLAASTVATADANSLGLTRGSGLKASGGASKAWGGTNWAATSAAGISGNKFVTFGLTVASDYSESLVSIDLHYRHSTDGPANGLWQYQLNNGAWVTISDTANLFPSTSASGASITLDLSSVSALQNLAAGTSVNFRLTPYGATSTTGTWYVYNQTGNDLSIKGSYSPVATGNVAANKSLFSAIVISSSDNLLIASK